MACLCIFISNIYSMAVVGVDLSHCGLFCQSCNWLKAAPTAPGRKLMPLGGNCNLSGSSSMGPLMSMLEVAVEFCIKFGARGGSAISGGVT